MANQLKSHSRSKMQSPTITQIPEDTAVDFVVEMALLMQELQIGISCSVVADPVSRKSIEKLRKKSENEIVEIVNKAILLIVSLMPIATEHGLNVIMNIVEMYSEVTGDPSMNDLIKKAATRINSSNLN